VRTRSDLAEFEPAVIGSLCGGAILKSDRDLADGRPVTSIDNSAAYRARFVLCGRGDDWQHQTYTKDSRAHHFEL